MLGGEEALWLALAGSALGFTASLLIHPKPQLPLLGLPSQGLSRQALHRSLFRPEQVAKEE